MAIFDSTVLLFTVLAEVYMLWDFFDNSFEVRECFAGKKKVCIIIGAILSIFVINMIKNSYVNLILTPIIYFGLVSLLFDVSTIINRIVYVFIVWVTLLLGKPAFVLLLEIPAIAMGMSAVTNLSDMTWSVFAVRLMSYLIFVIIKQLSRNGRHKMPSRIFLMYICQPIVSIVIMMVTYYSNNSTSFSNGYKIVMTGTFALLLFANILMFYAFNQYALQMNISMEQQVKHMKRKADEEYYAEVAEMNEWYRRFIHDSGNCFKTISILAHEGNTDKIISIVDEYIGEMRRSRAGIYCGHPVVNAILNEKMRDAETRRVKMNITADVNREILECISDGDIVCILGNLLDNALRAAEGCDEDEAYVRVRIYSKNEGQTLAVEVKNSYKEQLRLTEAGFMTTKPDKKNHGIGLKSVRRAVEKYNGFFMCNAEENEFVALAEVKTNG